MKTTKKDIQEILNKRSAIKQQRLNAIFRELEKGVEKYNDDKNLKRVKEKLNSLKFFEIVDVPVGRFVSLSDIKEIINEDVSVQFLGRIMSDLGIKRQMYREFKKGSLRVIKTKFGYYVK